MKVDLGRITEFPAEVSPHADTKDIAFELDGVRFVDGIDAELTIQKTEGEYFIIGTTSAAVEMECARCLEPAGVELNGEISLIALGPEYKGEMRPGVDEGEVTVGLDRNEILQLDEFVREALLTELPLKPLCKEDCKGLCPVCGGNRNLNPCNCEMQSRDPRWEALSKLK